MALPKARLPRAGYPSREPGNGRVFRRRTHGPLLASGRSTLAALPTPSDGPAVGNRSVARRRVGHVGVSQKPNVARCITAPIARAMSAVDAILEERNKARRRDETPPFSIGRIAIAPIRMIDPAPAASASSSAFSSPAAYVSPHSMRSMNTIKGRDVAPPDLAGAVPPQVRPCFVDRRRRYIHILADHPAVGRHAGAVAAASVVANVLHTP